MFFAGKLLFIRQTEKQSLNKRRYLLAIATMPSEITVSTGNVRRRRRVSAIALRSASV